MLSSSDPKKAVRSQAGRVGPSLDRGGSRASRAAGGGSAMSVQRVEQRANASSGRQRRSMSGPSSAGSASYRSSSPSNSASSASSNKGKRSADTTSSRKGSSVNGRRPASSPARDSQDVRFTQWIFEKWYNLNPEHKRRIFSFLLFLVAVLFFASLTLFHTVPFWAAIDHFFLTFFGWSTYILSIGLVAFAIVRLIETLRHVALVRGSLVIGLLILCLLISMESRLILGPMSAGVLTEILVLPLLSWAAPVQHILLFGLMIIVSIVTFRITFGHVLLVVRFVKRLFSDDRYIAGRQAVGAEVDDPSPYLGQRPQFSRYGGSRSGMPEPATQANSSSRGGRKASRIARVFNQGDEDQLDAVNAPDDFLYGDGNNDIHDDKTIAFDDHYTFDDDVNEQDPLNDINVHRGKVSSVSRSLRNPQPLDLTDHSRAVQGAAQQALPFVDQDQEEPHGILLQTPEEMEASPAHPYVAKPLRRVRQVNQKDSVRAEKPMGSIQLEQVQSVPARIAYDNTPHISSLWQMPNIDLLNSPEVVKLQTYGEDTTALAKLIQDTLRSFRVEAEVRAEDISIGPTIIRFGIRPTGRPELMKDERTGHMVPVRDAEGQIIYETRTRVSRIMALQNDLALVLEAKTIRMEAPVPGRPYVGVEIPNKNSRLVTLREVLESKEYQTVRQKSKLAIGLGKDVAGQVRVGDLAKMPHLLIAGATGAGKSVCINTIIASILMQATPDDVRLLMVDPKMVELNMYNGIPHLLSPVVIEVEKVVSLLKNAITEMERRYRLFSQLGVRNLDGYRKMRMEKIAQGDTSLNNLPAIVIIIDELADLMMAAPEEVEGMICRLAQLARATGIHLVVATQRPSVDVITGLIKANIPTRISFMVSSAVDSRTIIDMGGAERLLGRGDMLYLPADAGRPERIQGAFLTDEEAQHLTEYWHQQAVDHAVASGQPIKEEELEERVEPGWELRAEASGEDDLEDDLLYRAEEIVREYGRASISLLQRRLKIGYSRAARLIDLLEQHGIIGQSESNGRAREVYDHDAQDDYHQADDDAHSMTDEADDIMQEERARNDFLRNQAARFQGQGQSASAQAYIDDEDEN